MVYGYAMSDASPRYSITELADLARVTPRTVRYYLAQGLIPSPGSTGPGVKYGDDVLDRLRLIRRLQREHLPLAEIRTRLSGLDGPSIAGLADEFPTAGAASRSAPGPDDTALAYVRRLLMPELRPGRSLLKRVEARELPPPFLSSPPEPAVVTPLPSVSGDAEPRANERSQWERITLAQDVELHVRRPLPRPVSKKVDRLVTIARELLEEDPS